MALTKRYGFRTPDGSKPNAIPADLATLAQDVEARLGPVDDRSVVPRTDVVQVAKSISLCVLNVAGWWAPATGQYAVNATFPIYVGDSSGQRIFLPGLPVPAAGSESLAGACTGMSFGHADLWYSRAESLWFVQQGGQTLGTPLAAGTIITIGAVYKLA